MRLWIPGGKGMLGDAFRRLYDREATLLVTGRDVDVADPALVLQYAGDEQIDAIINCAAYTKVDQAEAEEAQAARDNGQGPEALARAATKLAVPVAHVSTDYVFPGDGRRPYGEDDATGPLSAYGRTKLDGEQRFLAALDAGTPKGRGYVVRTSWLFGPGGKNFVTTMLRLSAEREEVKVVEDQLGRPTYTDDLARALWTLVGGPVRTLNTTPPAVPITGGVYHFANEGQTSWHAFAVAVREGAVARGLPVKAAQATPIATSASPTPAKRPAWSVLDTAKIERALGAAPRPWRSALDEYLDAIAKA